MRVHTKSNEEYKNVIYPKNLDKYVKGHISHVSVQICVLSTHSDIFPNNRFFFYKSTQILDGKLRSFLVPADPVSKTNLQHL